ncbi:MAG TPA: DNA translocase FtsK 4TM domain-containing protein [Rhabdochlamydiaceae bacterium]|nr:DNA translocase FtsK 4TM domain-containing protein [Rhabdochlamydiaceae bacterium]
MAKKEKRSHSYRPEAKGLALLVSSLILVLSLLSFHLHDMQGNLLGLVGYGLGFALYYLFGLSSFLILFYLGWLGLQYLTYGEVPNCRAKNIYFSLFILSVSILLNLFAESVGFSSRFFQDKIYVESITFSVPYPQMHVRYNLGGVPLYYLYRDLPMLNLQHILSNVGTGLTFSITAIVSFLLFAEIPVLQLFTMVQRLLLKAKSSLLPFPIEEKPEPLQKLSPEDIEKRLTIHFPQPIYSQKQEKPSSTVPEESKMRIVTKREKAIAAQKVVNGDFAGYQFPPEELLKNPKKTDPPTIKKDLRRQAEILEEALKSFGVEAKVGEIHLGPTITSFEVHPPIGVKVQKIKALEDDLALNLQAKSIRIIAPIPGKAAVGVEVPSLYPQEVSFKELLLAYQQQGRKLHIPVLLGKTVSGENVMVDLVKMPHCIIAGATGSGKSVCINTVVMSILMNARPDEVKLLMIDPKKVELTSYTQLPHMIAPVITEAHGAYAALNWLVKEMQNRYEILKQLGLRNIGAFNTRKINTELETSLSLTVPEKMPLIVAIIDEFADLMMASSSDLETPIARIAQMARAVGIHLILATQRPSREVITGLIKANFPTRIAFKVASRINSQIILDEVGAESLLGNGDMLFMPPGSSQLIRAQGAYISDEEINNVISFICNQSPPNYLIPSFDSMRKEEFALPEAEETARDSLYDEARAIVIETGNASTTFLQRKLKIGYARAASLMDELETHGVISPQEGAKPRRVLLNKVDSDE